MVRALLGVGRYPVATSIVRNNGIVAREPLGPAR